MAYDAAAIKAAGLNNEIISKSLAVNDINRMHIYWLWIKLTIFSFSFIATILYFIKWANRWAEQHITSEFQLQQFYLDVNRANWLIESCLEWAKETETPIPPELLSSISGGLFSGNDPELEKVIHPADALASALMGTASNLKLKMGDNELEFAKPKKIAKAITIEAGASK